MIILTLLETTQYAKNANLYLYINARIKDVWHVLSNLEDIQNWSEAVIHAKCTSSNQYGIGTERVCSLKGNLKIREHWIEWEEGKSFKYEGFGLPMIKRATNRWTIIPEGDMSLLKSEAELELKGGLFLKIFEPLFQLIINFNLKKSNLFNTLDSLSKIDTLEV